jgi:hypothetical protein
LNLCTAYLLRQVAYFRLTISRHNHGAFYLVFGAKMLHERTTIGYIKRDITGTKRAYLRGILIALGSTSCRPCSRMTS